MGKFLDILLFPIYLLIAGIVLVIGIMMILSERIIKLWESSS